MEKVLLEGGIMEWICLVFLGVCSYLDIKYKVVRVSWCVYFALVCVVYQSVICHKEILAVAGSALLGGIVFILSLITKEAIGKGDGILLFSVGICLGFQKGMQIFMLGLFLIMLAGLILVLVKKVSLKERIPFVPFLFLGEAVWLICGIFTS